MLLRATRSDTRRSRAWFDVQGTALQLSDEVVETATEVLLSLSAHPAAALEGPIVRSLVALNGLAPDKAILQRRVCAVLPSLLASPAGALDRSRRTRVRETSRSRSSMLSTSLGRFRATNCALAVAVFWLCFVFLTAQTNSEADIDEYSEEPLSFAGVQRRVQRPAHRLTQRNACLCAHWPSSSTVSLVRGLAW